MLILLILTDMLAFIRLVHHLNVCVEVVMGLMVLGIVMIVILTIVYVVVQQIQQVFMILDLKVCK